MDYTYDRCMYFFTDGQDARANFFLDTDPLLQSITNSTCLTAIANSNHTTVESSVNASRIKNDFALYPSITSGPVNLEFNASKTGLAEVNIYNLAGAVVMKQQIAVTEGLNTKTINLNRLQNGVYIFQLNQDNTKVVKKLVLQH
jgi:hypothetical protein